MKEPALASQSSGNSAASWVEKSAWKAVWEKDLRSLSACHPDIPKLTETIN
jgi:hypothetical protein